MAAVRNLYRLVFSGRLFAAESWSCSLHIDAGNLVVFDPSIFQAALTTWFQSTDARISDAARLDEIKCNRINPVTGRYIEGQTSALLQNDMATGVAQATAPQLSVVISTRTALDRGRGHAGRFYPPSGAATPLPDGRIQTVAAGSMATTAATLLSAINAQVLGSAGHLVVFSKVAQTVEPITGVRVGCVIDTMRSRRTSLPEEPQSAVLT